MLHYSPFSGRTGERGRLIVRLTALAAISPVEDILAQFCHEYDEVQITHRNSGNVEVEFNIELNPGVHKPALSEELQKLEQVNRVRITVKGILEEN